MGEKCVLILEPDYYYDSQLEQIKTAGYLPVLSKCANQEELLAEVDKLHTDNIAVTAIFARLGLSFDRELFRACGGRLRWLITPTTGLNHIDLEELKRFKIGLISLKGETAFLEKITPTAELVFALLLALLRRLPVAHKDVLAGRWQRQSHLGQELKDLNLGIVGLGRLGTMTAGFARAFGMTVMAYDIKDEPFLREVNHHVQRKTLLRDLVAEADVVSIHLPWDQDTVGIIDEEIFRQFKRGAYLINTARGEMIDEAALLTALQEGILAGCAVDVLCGDSRWEGRVPEGNALLDYAREHDNLIITPHIGGYTINAILKTRSFLLEKFLQAQSEDKGVSYDG